MSQASLNFFSNYFNYVGETEAPLLYHRWMAVSTIAALLGRQVYLPFGHTKFYPNFYIILVGNPGARKGTAIWPAQNILRLAKYQKFASDRISPECFISEILQTNSKVTGLEDEELEEMNFDLPHELFVVAPEFGDFIGRGNFNFINLLTNLWDNLPEYRHPKLHGKSVLVNQPTINIVTGTTSQGLAMSIPIEAMGTGFMSRVILVYGEPTGIKITIPKAPDLNLVTEMADFLKEMKNVVQGIVEIPPTTMKILDRIYREYEDIEDFRFKHYSSRRFTHLLKLAIIHMASRLSLKLSEEDALFANTLLHITEQKMPKALGEFGKAKHSDVTQAVLEIIRHAKHPQTMKDIWKKLSQDLNSYEELKELVKNLLQAGKLQQTVFEGQIVWLPLNEVKNGWKADMLVPELFNIEERI